MSEINPARNGSANPSSAATTGTTTGVANDTPESVPGDMTSGLSSRMSGGAAEPVVPAPAAPRESPIQQRSATAARLVVGRGLFGGPAPLVPDDLYTRIVSGLADRRRHELILQPRAEADTNTYFGRFPASWWQRWTVCTEVQLSCVAGGSGEVALMASDANGEERVVAAQRLENAPARTVRLSAPIDRFADGGGMWLRARSHGDPLTVTDLNWTVAGPDRPRSAVLVICTCNRPEDCLNTLTALAGDPAALTLVDTIYVADQGGDAVCDRPRFAEVSAALGDKLRYLRQPNLGGAGGFTRGLYEAATRPEQTNVLFMDDDVLCDPEIVIRLTAFANRTITPTIVGGQMLYLLHPRNLHVGAEYADLEDLAPGLVVPRAPHDMDLTGENNEGRRNVQDRRVDPGYNGWWACLIPAEIVEAVGYPLPLFFQWDDVEYGYRAARHGFGTVTLPGAGLWHADFHWKDWDEWHRYFNIRNSLITAALHSRFRPLRVGRVLSAQLVRYLVSMQYGLAATTIKAIDDFLAGPDILADGGIAAMAEIRRLRDRYPETKLRRFTELPDRPELRPGHIPMIQAAPRPSRRRAVLAKRLVYQLLGRSAYQAGTVSAGDSYWWHVSLFDTAVVTDASQQGVRIRQRDRDLAIDLGRQAAATLRRFLREARAAQAAYRAALPTLVSRDNWTRLYQRSA